MLSSKRDGQATVCRHSDGINAFFFLPQRPNGAPTALRGGATRRWTKMAFTLAVELRFRMGSTRRLKRKSSLEQYPTGRRVIEAGNAATIRRWGY